MGTTEGTTDSRGNENTCEKTGHAAVPFPFHLYLRAGCVKLKIVGMERPGARGLLARFDISWSRFRDARRVKFRSIRREPSRGSGSRSPGFEQPGEIFDEGRRKRNKEFSREFSAFVKDSLTRSLFASGIISRGASLRISDNGLDYTADPFSSRFLFSIIVLESLSLSLSLVSSFLLSRSRSDDIWPTVISVRLRTIRGRSWNFPAFRPERGNFLFFSWFKNDSNQAHQDRCYFIFRPPVSNSRMGEIG